MFELFKFNPFFPNIYFFVLAGNNSNDCVDKAVHKKNIKPQSPEYKRILNDAEDRQNHKIELSTENIIVQSKNVLLQKQKQRRLTLREVIDKWKTMSFETIIKNNEVKTSGLSRKQLSLIRKYSAGLIGFKDFLQSIAITNKMHLLGVTSSVIYKTIYEALKICHPELVDWHCSYKQVDCSVRTSCSHFLSLIVKEKEPICFLVPKDVFSDNRIEYTRKELNWLMENHGAIKNVTFVFGCYEIRHEDQWNRLRKRIPNVIGFYPKELNNEAVPELHSEWQQKGWID